MYRKVTTLAATMSIIYLAPAHAYLDPGTASILLQGILGAVAAGLASIALFWRSIRDFVRRILTKSKPKKSDGQPGGQS